MFNISNIRNSIVGIDRKVTLLNGTTKQYVFLDNAASTPSFTYVRNKVNELLEWYSAVHRGAGIKSIISTRAYDESARIIGKFVNANPDSDVVIFTSNATGGLNKISHRMNYSPGDVVLTTQMEHHSNDLPWRNAPNLDYINIKEDGTLDVGDALRKIEKYSGNLRLVTVTGASNVTGYVNPYHDIAEMAHKHGALFVLDAAQLAPHRAIDMNAGGNKKRKIDFTVMSGHKMYAPYGSGVLIGPRDFFDRGDPDYVGGGTVKVVTYDEVHWNDPPEKDESGSPNVTGAVAFAATVKVLEEIGMDKVAEHEKLLTKYAWEKLSAIPEVQLLAPPDYDDLDNRLGVIAFNIDGLPDGKVAAILCYEGGIGVRTGCFCAHPYLKKLLKVTVEESQRMIKHILSGRWINIPGAIRASFGIYNNFDDVSHLVDMINRIIAGDYIGEYELNESTGEYFPKGLDLNPEEYFII